MLSKRMAAIGLLVYLLALVGAGHSSSRGLVVTSCAACHERATCHTLPVADETEGDASSGQSITCTCKEGFSGDGLTCSPSPAASVDGHTPRRSRRSAGQSNVNLDNVRISCGFYECPSGQACLTTNGYQECGDPCQTYTALDNNWRSTQYKSSNSDKHCDRDVKWEGWYRMYVDNVSTSMPEKCVDPFMCGTQAPMWLASPAPQLKDGVAQRKVCASFRGSCCWVETKPIYVKACPGDYFVYKFVTPPGCYFAYCAAENPLTTTRKPATTTITTTTPVKVTTTTPVKVTTTTEAPVKVTTTTEAPVKVTTTTPVKGTTTTKAPVKVTTTTKAPVKVTTTTKAPVKVTTTTEAPVKVTTTTEAPVKVTTTTEAPVKVTTRKAPVKVTTTTKAPVKVTTTTKAPVKVTTTTEAPVKVTTTTEAPVKVTTTTEAPVKVTTTTKAPEKVTTTTPVDITTTTTTPVDITTTTTTTKRAVKPRIAVTTPAHVSMTTSKAMCGSCKEGESCVSDDGANWRCKRPEKPVLPAPELVCGRALIEVGLRLSSLDAVGLDASTAHLADPRCHTQEEHNGTVWYQVERTEGTCGNVLKTNGTHAIYSNSLFVYPIRNVHFTRPVSVPFSCAYPLGTNTSLDIAIRPYLSLMDGVAGIGSKVKAYMSLYRNGNYTAPYPAGGVRLAVGSVLHVGVSVEETETERFVVVLEECYATHSSDPEDLMRYYLIQRRCPSERRQVSVEENGSSLQAHFSALLFLFQGDYRDIFLHCNLSLCDQRSSSCSPVCSKRSYRSVTNSVPLKPLTIGPITYFENLN